MEVVAARSVNACSLIETARADDITSELIVVKKSVLLKCVWYYFSLTVSLIGYLIKAVVNSI